MFYTAIFERGLIMYCNKCGKILRDGVQFCPYCGESVSGMAAGKAVPVTQPDSAAAGVKCSYCGKIVEPGQEFCNYCNRRVNAPDPRPAPAPTPRPAPAPAPTPRPAPSPTPRSAPSPTPRPAPSPTPRSAPTPTPRPAPSPTPRSAPAPTPRSAPAPTPRPAPPRPDPVSVPDEENYDNGTYLSNFFKAIFKGHHAGALIWIALNAALFGAAGAFVGSSDGAFGIVLGILAGIAVYVLTVVLSLSSVGEYVSRIKLGAKQLCVLDSVDGEDAKPGLISGMTKAFLPADQYNRIRYLFDEVYDQAKKSTPGIREDIELFMNNDDSYNAFAVGRKTLCFNKGLLALPDDEICGILGHEFGHLAHRDTYLLTFTVVGNLLFDVLARVAYYGLTIFIWIFGFILGLFLPFISYICEVLMHWIKNIVMILFTRVWDYLAVLLCMGSSRAQEFAADRYSCVLGFGKGLLSFFEHENDKESQGLWGQLASSHPPTPDRIDAISAYLHAA